jgi:hypothetical protein
METGDPNRTVKNSLNYVSTCLRVVDTRRSEQNVYTEYADPKRSEWITKIQPALKKLPLSVLVKECGTRLSRREIIELRAGRSRPHRKNQELLAAILKNLKLV